MAMASHNATSTEDASFPNDGNDCMTLKSMESTFDRGYPLLETREHLIFF